MSGFKVITPLGINSRRGMIMCSSDRRDVDLGLTQKRLEVGIYFHNTALQFLKRLSDGIPIFKRFGEGEVVLHLHFDAGIDFRARW